MIMHPLDLELQALPPVRAVETFTTGRAMLLGAVAASLGAAGMESGVECCNAVSNFRS